MTRLGNDMRGGNKTVHPEAQPQSTSASSPPTGLMAEQNASRERVGTEYYRRTAASYFNELFQHSCQRSNSVAKRLKRSRGGIDARCMDRRIPVPTALPPRERPHLCRTNSGESQRFSIDG
jgi:hypothetical protein